MSFFSSLFKSSPAKSTSNPWAPSQSHLKGILGSAEGLYNADPTGSGFMSNPLIQKAGDTIGGLMDFDYGQLTDLVKSQVMPSVNANFSAAGRTGSGAHAGAVAQGMARGLAPFMLQANQQQLGAANAGIGYGQMQANAPWDALARYSNFAQGIGGMGGTSTQRAAQASPFQQAAGIGLGIAGLFSDERLKEDIKKVGKTDGGLGVFTYKYKGDPDKVTHMGVMAQEMKSKGKPGVFKSSMGPLAVDYSKVA